jgi:hypothetical protein
MYSVIFKHNVSGNICNGFDGIMKRNLYMNDKNNSVHLGSRRFITILKCYIRGSMVRHSALFLWNDNRGFECV